MRKKVVTSVVMVIAVFFAVGAVKLAHERARRTAEASARACLAASIREALTDYYGTHGSFPNALAELPSGAIKFCDGATPDMLASYSYRSEGTHFTLAYQGFVIHQIIGPGPDITDAHVSDRK
jgi:type II secretory pathway pseudopilin PulG